MGIVQSIFCSITFCVERVLTWTCCAFLLMLLMFTVVLLMVYGISVGYHYAQKELSTFAMASRSTSDPAAPGRRSGDEEYQPVVRLLAVNQTEAQSPRKPLLEVYRTDRPSENVYLENSPTPVIMLETERPPREPELSPHEKEFAKRLIGRIRRSKNNTETTTGEPFLRPLRNSG